jgi:hypothetical protein
MGIIGEFDGFRGKYSDGGGMGISSGVKGKGSSLTMGMVCPPCGDIVKVGSVEGDVGVWTCGNVVVCQVREEIMRGNLYVKWSCCSHNA